MEPLKSHVNFKPISDFLYESRRQYPNKGPSHLMILGFVVSGISFGWYKVWEGKQHKRIIDEEVFEIRKTITPFLQAERDLIYLQEKERFEEWETKVMSRVDGWVVGESEYKTPGFWVPPPQAIFGNF